MPYESRKQQRFFEGCRHNPKHMKGRCPDEKTLDEFHAAEKREGTKLAFKRFRKEST